MTSAITNQEAMKQWAATRPQSKQKNNINHVYADHVKFQGEVVNPDFGKLFAVSYTEANEEVKKEIVLGKTEMHLVAIRKKVSGNYNKEEKRSDLWAHESNDFETELFNQKGDVVAAGSYFEIMNKMKKGDFPEIKNIKCEDIVYVLVEDTVYRWRLAIGGYLKNNELMKVAEAGNGLTTFVISKSEAVTEDGQIKRASFTFATKGEVDVVKAITHGGAVRKMFKANAERGQKEDQGSTATAVVAETVTPATTSVGAVVLPPKTEELVTQEAADELWAGIEAS
jgi:hypothetical protein